MTCCGKGRVVRIIRQQASQEAPVIFRTARIPASPPKSTAMKPVGFQYTGHSGMTIFGPVTGSRYRFSQPGAVVIVDARDAPTIAAVPHLRRLET